MRRRIGPFARVRSHGSVATSAALVALALVATFIALAGPLVAPARSGEVVRLERYPIEIRFEPKNRRVADKVRAIVERDIPELTAELGMSSVQPIEVRIEDDIASYRRTFGEGLPTWGVAFAVMEEQVIVVDVARATRQFNSLDHVIPHELSHLLLAQRTPRVRYPIWFMEGLAQWQAREWSLVDSWQLMNAVWGNRTPHLLSLVTRYPTHEEPARTAYRLSHAAFVDRFGEKSGDLPEFLDVVRRRGDFDGAFEEYFGENVATFAAEFDGHLRAKYHSRLLVFQTGPLFSVLAVLFLAVALRYHIRKRRKLRELERSEGGLSLDE